MGDPKGTTRGRPQRGRSPASHGLRVLDVSLGLSRLDDITANRIACSQDPFGENLGPQASSMHEAFFDAGDGEAFEVTAGFAEPQTAQAHLADLELLADQVIEGDPGRDQVPARLARRDLDLIVSRQGGEGFFLDESHLAVALSRLAEGAALLVIAIAFEAQTQDGTGLLDRPGLCPFGWCDVDSDQFGHKRCRDW